MKSEDRWCQNNSNNNKQEEIKTLPAAKLKLKWDLCGTDACYFVHQRSALLSLGTWGWQLLTLVCLHVQHRSAEAGAGLHLAPLLQMWPLEKSWTTQPLSESCISKATELWALLLEWLLGQGPRRGSLKHWGDKIPGAEGLGNTLGLVWLRAGAQCPSKNQSVLSLEVRMARAWSFQVPSPHRSQGPLTALICHS